MAGERRMLVRATHATPDGAVSPKYPACKDVQSTSVLHRHPAVDDNVVEPFGVLMRLRKCGLILNLRGVKDHQIGGEPLADKPTIAETKGPGRQRRHTPDCVFQRDDASVSNELRYHPGIRSV